jgi:hypothetical protein
MLEDCLPLDDLHRLTPEESADVLKFSPREEFVWFMRRSLPPEDAQALTDEDLHRLHEEMCARLEAKAALVDRSLPSQSEFLRRWFAAVDQLTPQEAADILTRTSTAEFVKVMRLLLPPEDSRALTDAELRALHATMCERLEVRSRTALGSWERSAPVGRA